METLTQTKIISVTKVSINLSDHSQGMRYVSRKLAKAKTGKELNFL